MSPIARVLLACALLGGPLAAQDPDGPPNVRRDQPLTASGGSDAMRMFFAMEPYVAQARASGPEAWSDSSPGYRSAISSSSRRGCVTRTVASSRRSLGNIVGRFLDTYQP